MKHKHKDIEGSRREFAVKVSPEEISKRLEEAYVEMMKVVNIPGFRKGKAPRHIVEKYHSKDAREKVLTDVVSEGYRKALAESGTHPVGLPVISDVVYEDGKAFTFKATVDIRPDVKLKDYRNIKIHRKVLEIKDEDVERYVAALRESYAQFKPVEGRPAKMGDYLICDIACEADGKPIYKEQKNIFLPLDKSHSIPEVINALIGAAAGDSKEVEATLPKDDAKTGHSGKKAVFKTKIHGIKERELPEINDEFVKSLGGFENLNELKEAVRKDLGHKRENMIRADISNQVLEQLLGDNSFAAPKGLIDEETERLIGEADKKKENGEFKKNAREKAEKSVRLFFILDEIARIEKISISEKEIDDTLGLLARQSNTTKENVKKHYEEKDLMGGLRQQLKENKVIEFLISKADVKEAKN